MLQRIANFGKRALGAAPLIVRLPFAEQYIGMTTARTRGSNAALASLETAVTATRDGFACMFSTSDEYEAALIAQRRAQGHYDRPRSFWPMLMFIGCALAVAGCAVLFG